MCDTYADAEEMLPLLSDVVNCKRAAIVAVFFTYIMYTVTTGLIYLLEYKKKEEVVNKIKAFKSDIETKQFYILALALLIQIQTPTAFPVVILYLYLLTFPLLLVGHLKQEKWIIKLVAVITQYLFVFILLMFVLINPWCRYYYYRYIVGVPPDSYYQQTQQQSAPETTVAPNNNYQPTPAPESFDNSTNSTDSTDGNIDSGLLL